MKTINKIRCFLGYHTYVIKHIEKTKKRGQFDYTYIKTEICCKNCPHVFAKEDTNS